MIVRLGCAHGTLRPKPLNISKSGTIDTTHSDTIYNLRVGCCRAALGALIDFEIALTERCLIAASGGGAHRRIRCRPAREDTSRLRIAVRRGREGLAEVEIIKLDKRELGLSELKVAKEVAVGAARERLTLWPIIDIIARGRQIEDGVD